MTKRICTICARGGSKGVLVKNTAPLEGIPLIAHSIRQARESGIFDQIVVSSDSEEILAVAEEYGVELLIRRPAELADDHSDKLLAIRHCVEAVEQQTGIVCDTLVDLDATSPLRDVADIRGAVSLMEEEGVSNVITVKPAYRSPYFNMVEQTAEGRVRLVKPLDQRIVRRQDAPPCFDMNASIYVWQRQAFFGNPSIFYDDTQLYVMPEERSRDIDSYFDLEVVAFLMERKRNLDAQ